MTNIQTVKQKLLLKNQSIKFIRSECDELKRQLILLQWKDDLTGKLKAAFDPAISRKLDCILFLLEE